MSCCKTYNPCVSNNGSYASTAGQYATDAAKSAANAAASATQASTAEANAKEYAIEAAQSAAISGIYLGAKATAPSLDNQGNPLEVGMQYFNTVDNTMYVWDGTSWISASAFNETTPFLAAGTTTARDLQERFADAVNVKDFGAVGDGVADDTAAIQAAINAAAANNCGIVELDSRSYAISSTITVPSAVTIVGKGSSQYPPAGSFNSAEFLAQPKTRLLAMTGWASNSPMISIKTAPASEYTLQGVTLQGFMIDCGGIAERGIDVVSVKHSRFFDLLVYRPLVVGILEDVLSGGDITTQGNNATQFNTWDAITIWVGNTGSATGWRQTGTSLHNINQSTYNNIQIVHANGVGFDLVNSDTNLYTRLTTFSFGIGVGCIMRGANLS